MNASDIFDVLDETARDRLRKKRQPEWTSPMLAVLSDEVFSSPDWIYERKLDGIRCLAFREGDRARIVSRNRKDLTKGFPELAEALERDPRSRFVVDGEIVAFDGDVTSFSRLQGRSGIRDPDRARETGIAVYLYLFDLLHVADRDTTKLALRDRKRLLKDAVTFEEPIRYTAHRNRDGEAYHRDACRKGWEGIIAKRADGEYVHARSKDWLKFKCVNRQELVVGGFTDPKGSRRDFGALLVGYYEGDDFVYAGRVGTGYDDETLGSLAKELKRIERKTSPFDDGDPDSGGVHWVRPEVVVEVGFTEWTRDGRLRHPRYVGRREDKEPREVVRERASGG